MSRHSNVYRPIVGFVKRSTEKAILLVVTNPEALTDEDAEIEAWIPKSQLAGQRPMRDAKGNTEVMASEWILKEKDLLRLVAKAPAPAANNPSGHPPVPTTPPAKNWMDEMDDDIPY